MHWLTTPSGARSFPAIDLLSQVHHKGRTQKDNTRQSLSPLTTPIGKDKKK